MRYGKTDQIVLKENQNENSKLAWRISNFISTNDKKSVKIEVQVKINKPINKLI